MSETNKETTTEQADETKDTSSETQEVDWKSEAEKWKAFSRKNEADFKQMKAKAAKWEEHEKAQLSETERLQAELDEARRELKQSQLTAMRNKIAGEYGVPAEHIHGDSEEELTESAKRLREFVESARPKRTSGDKGVRGDDIKSKDARTDINSLLRAAFQ